MNASITFSADAPPLWHPVSMSFGSHLALLMAKAGVSQSELARRLPPMTSQAVNQWIKGVTVPDLRKLESIADALGVPLPQLVDWERSPARQIDPQDVPDLPHKMSELDLLAIWRAISDEGQIALMITARALAASSPRHPRRTRRHK